jgi:hypothetical protein
MKAGTKVKYNSKAVRTFGCDSRERGVVTRTEKLGPRVVLFIKWDDGSLRKTGSWLLQEISK